MAKEMFGIYGHKGCTDVYYIKHIPYIEVETPLEIETEFTPEVKANIHKLVEMAYEKKMPYGTVLDYHDYF